MKEPARSLAWDDFRLIQAVAASAGLAGAAARLGIDPSTVYRRLQQIEQLLGTRLFERHRAGYTLTQAGEEITALAARVDEDITAVLRRLAGAAPSPAGEVRIGTSDALLELIAPMLARFRVACPAIRLDIVTGNAAVNLSRRDADVVVRATATPPEILVGRRVARIAWALYGPEGTVPLAPEALAGTADWVTLAEHLSSLPAAQFVRRHVDPGRIGCTLDSVRALARAIQAGLGVGFLPCFAGDAMAGLVRLDAPLPPPGDDLWLLTHPDLRHTPRVRALMDALAAELSACRAAIEGATEPADSEVPKI